MVDVHKDNSGQHGRVNIKVLECLFLFNKSRLVMMVDTYVARGVHPCVVDGAHVLTSLSIDFLKHSNLLLEAFFFVIDSSDGGQ